MKFLIDTNILLWYIGDDSSLPEEFKAIIENRVNIIFVSIVSLWEIGIKYSLGKLNLPVTLDEFFEDIEQEFNFEILMLNRKSIIKASALPFIHRDPFDRILFSQAKTENLNFLYTDKIFNQYQTQLS